MLALSLSLHKELADKNVRVQAVVPGATATDFWEIAGQPVELRIASISPITVRISVLPNGATDADLNRDGGLVPLTEQRRTVAGVSPVKMGTLSVTVTPVAS